MLPAGIGFLALSGQPATLRYSRKMVAVNGTLTLSGQAASLTFARHLSLAAGNGTLTLSGKDANLAYGAPAGRFLIAETGTIVLAGKLATLIPPKQQPGVFHFGRTVTIPNRW